jgi:hypothetical protein
MRRGRPREWIESGACGGPAFALSAAPLFRSRRICQQRRQGCSGRASSRCGPPAHVATRQSRGWDAVVINATEVTLAKELGHQVHQGPIALGRLNPQHRPQRFSEKIS